MSTQNQILVFGMSHRMLFSELDSIAKKHALDLGHRPQAPEELKDDYYPQFEAAVRAEAAAMSRHYEIFYCLEKSIRALVKEKLQAEKGSDWWQSAVPNNVRENASKNKQREADSGVTARSSDMLDYTTFGELGEIVRANWDAFSDTFNSDKAFSRVMNSLNLLRGPIAHCSPLAADEVDRLRLTLRDWFRLME